MAVLQEWNNYILRVTWEHWTRRTRFKFNKSQSEEFHMHRRTQTRDQMHMERRPLLCLFQNNAVTRKGFDLQGVAEYEMFLRPRTSSRPPVLNRRAFTGISNRLLWNLPFIYPTFSRFVFPTSELCILFFSVLRLKLVSVSAGVDLCGRTVMVVVGRNIPVTLMDLEKVMK